MAVNRPVSCTRCRVKHDEADRVPRARKRQGAIAVSDLVCPRCGATSYYDERPAVAWCWRTGLIEIGEELPPDSEAGGGAIELARGPWAALKAEMQVAARRSRCGQLLVPGVPEAADDDDAVDAVIGFVNWRGRGPQRHGVAWNMGQGLRGQVEQALREES